MPSSRAAAASRKSCTAATAIWCGSRPSLRIIDEVPAGRVYKDGSLLVEAEARTVADRKRLSFAGCVSVALALDDKGELVADPELDLIGIPERDRDGGRSTDAVYDAVLDTVEQLPRKRRGDPDAVAEAVRRGVRAAVGAALGQEADVPCACR